MTTRVRTATPLVYPTTGPTPSAPRALPPKLKPVDFISNGAFTQAKQFIAPVAVALQADLQGTAFDGMIGELYQLLLGRAPDGAGLEHFRQVASALAAKGVSEAGIHAAISQEIEGSDEFVDRLVTEQYRQLLGRDPDGAGLQSFREVVRGAANPDDARAQVAAQIKSSREYVAAHPEVLVEDVYQRLLNRPADGGGLQHWSAVARRQLNGGASPEQVKAALETSIRASDEYQALHLDELVNGVYREVLGRDADGQGLQYFTQLAQQQLQAGKSIGEIRADLVGKMMASPEYAAKHAPPVTAPPPPTGGAGRVPYINQYAPVGAAAAGYSNAASNCGPASMAMVARAVGYGGNMSDAALIMHLGRIGGTTGAGTGVNGISAMARAMGQPVTMRGPGAQVQWMADQLRAGKLVIANGDYYAMPPHQNEAKTSGHYICVAGLDANGNFIVRDPADGNARTVTPAQMQYFINQNPNGGYQFAIG